MARNITMNQLTEGIRDRHLGAERGRLTEKWTRTGLLRGLDDYKRETMSQLLENQAAQALREANQLGGGATGTGGPLSSGQGNINGFTNIAFPIVRRVFGGLVANDLVSIQPMSLPSGLLFYLDYTYGQDVGGDQATGSTQTIDGEGDRATFSRGQSLYGNPAGKSIREGADAVGGQYDLAGTSYSQVHSASLGASSLNTSAMAGAFAGGTSYTETASLHATGSDGKLIQFDPQLTSRIEANTHQYMAAFFKLGGPQFEKADLTNVKSIAFFTGSDTNTGDALALRPIESDVQQGDRILNVRRLNEIGTWDGTTWTPNPFVTRGTTNAALKVIFQKQSDGVTTFAGAHNTKLDSGKYVTCSYVIADELAAGPDGTTGATLTIPSFESDFGSTPQPIIPEIDIKIESIAVTATTRKLRARWSPELAQDLNAYHSLDAEVELTQILSEQIALEIDREILNDLLVGAQGANYYWSRAPGKFVNKRTGAAQALASTLQIGPAFTGTVREWYETLVETIIDVANEIHRKTLRGSANFIVVSPEVATIFEASVLYKPNIKIDGQGQVGSPMQLGAAPIGSLSNRFTVYKDPYFPRNKVLVGYKGGSYLETGYVYAPYVPLIVTPTIFAPEDFTPRKGVMTRYGKKMVRADFYGTVTCIDMDVI